MPGVSGSLHDILRDVGAATDKAAAVRPHRLIVAWHGVLTLAFEAWPKRLVELKERVGSLPEFRSSPENFGTRWPKATLAALNDDAPPLTPDQLRELTELCREFDSALEGIGEVPLAHCSVVLFASRSLERVLSRVDYALSREGGSDPLEGSDSSSSARRDEEGGEEYDANSYEIVRDVVSETERLDEYIRKVNAPGHRRGEHYDATWTEATLACFLTSDDGGCDDDAAPADSPPRSTSRLLAVVASFRERADALLPGAYSWMPPESFHLSLRALESRVRRDA